MKLARMLVLVCVSCLMLVRVVNAAEVTAEKSEKGVVVKIDGDLFTEYLEQPRHQPALWPVIGPTGKPVTRAYPIGPKDESESSDHVHHHSLWFTHGDVNGIDFWTENSTRRGPERGHRILHREYATIESGPQAKIVAHSEWMTQGKKFAEDVRTLVFGVEEDGDRWIDCTINIKATEHDLTFGDTKEGSFSVRVADTMKVEAKKGGRVVNSEGQTDDDAWGMPANWVDYHGPVDGETVGIAILSHPDSFRSKTRWHVRGYGLFAANPFGQKDFPKPEASEQGEVTVKKGDDLTLRYRVIFHKGDTEAAEIAKAYAAYAAAE